MGIFVALDVVNRLLHTNHFLELFYNDSCQYISDFHTRIAIKKRILLTQGLFRAEVTRPIPQRSIRL
jgi:hypothetical protein